MGKLEKFYRVRVSYIDGGHSVFNKVTTHSVDKGLLILITEEKEKFMVNIDHVRHITITEYEE